MKKILIADPDEVSTAFLRKTLGLDHEIVESTDGVDIIAKILAEAPDLLIISDALPRMKGSELCHKMRCNKIGTPVIVISNEHRRAHDEAEMLARGVDATLLRPVSARLLKMKVRNFLARFPAGNGHRIPSPAVEPSVLELRANGKNGKNDAVILQLDDFRNRVRLEVQLASENDLLFCLAFISRRERKGENGQESLASSTLEKFARAQDTICPLPDAFLLLLTDTTRQGALALVDRIRRNGAGKYIDDQTTLIFEFNGSPNFWEYVASQLQLQSTTDQPKGELAHFASQPPSLGEGASSTVLVLDKEM